MSKKVTFNEEFNVALMPGFNAIASTDVKVQRPIITMLANDSKKTVLFWGDNNTFPQDVITDVRKDPEIGTLLDKQANLLYSGGLMWGIPGFDANGNKILTPLEQPINAEIMLWLRRSNINRYLAEAAKDIYYFNNAFPEIVLQADRKKIIQICAQAAEECRFGVQNSKGLIDVCLLNAQWQTAKDNDPLTKMLPVLDAYYNPAAQLTEGNKLNYIYPLNYANPGNKFYQMADWNSIRESGWLEVSQLIPQFKKALLKNQMTIKYHIKIMNTYWTIKFDGYDGMSLPERKAIKEKEMTALQDMLVGAEKAGKSFISPKFWDANSNKEVDLIQIESIDDKIQDGKYLEDGKDASLYKGAAIGLHPALVGSVPNSGMGGAGSNIREAYNLHVLSSRSRQDLILEPLNNLLIEYNGWPLEMEFAFRNQFMTTLDAGKETTSNTSNTPTK